MRRADRPHFLRLRQSVVTSMPRMREASPSRWQDAAKAFFTDALVERVTGLYGIRPSVEFVQIAALVENAR